MAATLNLLQQKYNLVAREFKKKCMLLTNVLLFLCFMDVYALEVLFPINETIIHRNMEFGPYYGNSCI